MLTARRGDRLEQLAGELKTLRARPRDPDDRGRPGRSGDARRGWSPRRIARFGGLDVLVNNAGLGLPTLFADAEPEHLARQIAVNFTAPLMLTPALLAVFDRTERDDHQHRLGDHLRAPTRPWAPTARPRRAWPTGTTPCVASCYSKGVTVCLVEPGPIKTEFMDALTVAGACRQARCIRSWTTRLRG